MRKLLFAFLLTGASLVQAEVLKTTYNPFTGRPDYIINIGSTSVGSLVDVSTEGIGSGQCLVWDGDSFEPGECGGGGGGASLAVSFSSSTPVVYSTMNFTSGFYRSVTGSTVHIHMDPTVVLFTSSATATYLQNSSATLNYLTLSSASATYMLASSAPLTNFLSLSSAALTYLQNSSATINYLTLSSASATYMLSSSAPLTNFLSVSSAVLTYLQLSSATANYLSKSSAAATYLPYAQLIAGANISITPAPGSLTIASTGGSGGGVSGSTASITYAYDGGGSAITAGSTRCVTVPYSATVSSWTILSYNTAGSASVHVSSATYDNFPTLSNMSGFGNGPTLTSSQKNASVPIGWGSTLINQGSIVCSVLDSVSTSTTLNVVLWLIKS